MAYSALTFTASEVPTLTKWNQLWANDASFNNGTGIGAGAINNTHIAAAALYKTKITNPYKFNVCRAAAYNHPGGGWAKCPLDTKTFDTGGNFDNLTNFRFTAPITGYYQVQGHGSFGGGSALTIASIYKNGVEFTRGNKSQGAGSGAGMTVGDLVFLTAGDYLELWIYNSGSVSSMEPGSVGVRPFLSGGLDCVA